MRPTFVAVAATAAVLTVGLAAPSSVAAQTDSNAEPMARQRCEKVTVIGHRGVGGPHENTVKGWNLARKGGADVVEADVWLTKDGVPVIIHDPRWNRTTNWHGKVRETPYRVVRKHIRTDGGDRIPTLKRALRWSARHGVGLMADVKWSPDFTRVARRIERLGIRNRVSFYQRPHHRTGTLAAIDRARGHGLRTGVKAWHGRWPMTPEEIRSHGGYIAVAKKRADNPKYVRRMHRAGLEVYPKGSTRKYWPALLRADVDGLSVPNPRRYRRWCRSRTP